MRLGVVVFLFTVGVVAGGACSPRSLLTVTLKPQGLAPMETFNGAPRLDVKRPGSFESIKHVDKTDAGPDFFYFLDDDQHMSVTVGIYLPGDVEGTVEIHAELVSGACVWSNVADVADVHSGDTTEKTIEIKRGNGCPMTTASPPDGGTTLVGDAGDGGAASDAGDGGADGPDLLKKCLDYCMNFQKACGTQVQYGDFAYCTRICRDSNWPDGKSSSPPENSFACRWDHLRVVLNDASLACSECYAASPDSPGICGPPPDAGTRDACPPSD
jgi:hypothetical protein